jgi:type VI secretion system secreted protein Hcp
MKDIYIDFGQGEIQGEVRDNKFKSLKAIEVHSWAHSIVQPKSATSSTAGGHTAERVEHGEMVFTKDIDKASPQIWMAASAGTIYKEVKISFFRAVGGSNTTTQGTTQTRQEYLTITLRNVLFAHVNSFVGDGDLPSEEFGLKYSAVKWEYREAKIDGVANNAVDRTGKWDLATNLPNY